MSGCDITVTIPGFWRHYTNSRKCPIFYSKIWSTGIVKRATHHVNSGGITGSLWFFHIISLFICMTMCFITCMVCVSSLLLAYLFSSTPLAPDLKWEVNAFIFTIFEKWKLVHKLIWSFTLMSLITHPYQINHSTLVELFAFIIVLYVHSILLLIPFHHGFIYILWLVLMKLFVPCYIHSLWGHVLGCSGFIWHGFEKRLVFLHLVVC